MAPSRPKITVVPTETLSASKNDGRRPRLRKSKSILGISDVQRLKRICQKIDLIITGLIDTTKLEAPAVAKHADLVAHALKQLTDEHTNLHGLLFGDPPESEILSSQPADPASDGYVPLQDPRRESHRVMTFYMLQGLAGKFAQVPSDTQPPAAFPPLPSSAPELYRKPVLDPASERPIINRGTGLLKTEVTTDPETGKPETIIRHLERVWMPWIEARVLTRSAYRRLDPIGEKALENWITQKKPVPAHLHLPTKAEIIERQVASMTEDDMREAQRLAKAIRRRLP